MGYNYIRDKRRNHISNQEIRDAITRYNSECGEVLTREATPQEIEKHSNKTKKRG